MGDNTWRGLVQIREELTGFSGSPAEFVDEVSRRLEKETPFELRQGGEEGGENSVSCQTREEELQLLLPESAAAGAGDDLARLAGWFLDWVADSCRRLSAREDQPPPLEPILALNRLLVNQDSPQELMQSLADYFAEYFSLEVSGIWLNKEETFVQLYRRNGTQQIQPPARYLMEDEEGKWRDDPFEHRDYCWLTVSDREGLTGLIAFSDRREELAPKDSIQQLLPLVSIYLRRLERSITTGRHELYELRETETLTREQFETSQGLKEVWQTIVDTIANMFECDACRLFLLEDEQNLTLKAEYPPGELVGSTIKVEEDPLVKSVIQDEKAVLFNNLPEQVQDSRRSGGVRSLLAVPFRYKGEVIGTVNLSSETADIYTREDLDKLTHFCDNLATVYHNTAEFANLTGYVDELLANLPVGVINIDAESDNVFLNQTAREILDISGEGIEYESFADHLEEELKAEELLEFIREGYRRPAEKVRRVKLQTEDSHPRFLSVSSTAIEDVSGAETRMLFVLTDITEQHLLNKQVNRQERLAALGELASSLAHEIKNPLTSIIGFAQLIPQRAEDTEFIEKMGRIVGKEAERLNSLVENLLSFGRPQVGSRMEVSIQNTIEDITVLTRKKLEKQEIELEVDIHADLTVYGDPVKVKQIFLNLVLNAIDAMPDGGELEITGDMEDGLTEISVCDTGVGMEEDEINKIFNPFFTTKEEGTGLGLAITHRIVEEHDGEIKVNSSPGKGSRMLVRLPASEESLPSTEGEISYVGQN